MSAIFDNIQSIPDYSERRRAIQALSPNDKEAYMKHQNKLRQSKYRSKKIMNEFLTIYSRSLVK